VCADDVGALDVGYPLALTSDSDVPLDKYYVECVNMGAVDVGGCAIK